MLNDYFKPKLLAVAVCASVLALVGCDDDDNNNDFVVTPPATA